MTRKLLIVDDNEQILRLVQRLLSTVGYDISTTTGPEQAIAWCEQFGAPDLLISDVRMPVMSGPQLYDVLKTKLGDFPVLFMSGDTSSTWQDETQQVLEKPFSRLELVEAINSHFTSND